MDTTHKTILSLAFFFGWALFAIWHFFWSFPLINLPPILLNIAMLLILLVFFTALGRRILRTFSISLSSFAEECSFSFGLGTGFIIVLMIGLATTGLLYKSLIITLVLGIYGIVYKDARFICISVYNACVSFVRKKKTREESVWAVFLGIATVITLLAAATPPFFYDALVYHLAVPQQYLLKHGFHEMAYHHFSHFPMNLGMLFLIGMSFSGGMLAKLISWAFAPMTVLAVYGFSQPRWGHHIALLASVITLFVPGILILSMLTSVDLGIMFYSFLGFTALLTWFSSHQQHHFVLAGLFCSIAAGTKYTAILLTCIPLILILLIYEWMNRKHSFWAGIQKTIVMGCLILSGMMPWLVKNTLYTGNPVYPLLNSFFTPRVVNEYTHYDNYFFSENPGSKLLHAQDSLPKAISALVIKYLTAPWTVTMKTNRTAGKIGVLFLLCLPGVVLFKRIEPTLQYMIALAGGAFWLWFIVLPDSALRYVFQIIPLLSIVIAVILWRMIDNHLHHKTYLLVGICLLLSYHFALFFRDAHILHPFSYLFGNQSQEEFLLGHGVDYYPVIQAINQHTPQDATILFVAEQRGYYCERDTVISTNFTTREGIILRQLILASEHIGEVLHKLRQLHITHILLNTSEMQRFTQRFQDQDSYFGFKTEKDRQILQTLFSPQYTRHLMSQDGVNLYELL